MLKVNDFEIPSFKTWNMVTQGTRNSWESHDKSDSIYKEYSQYLDQDEEFVLGAEDKALFLKLIKAGKDHSKFMRQLPVILDLTSSNYFFKELDTYQIGMTQNSTSQMHVLGKYPFTADMFSFEDMNSSAVELLITFLNGLRDEWIASGKAKGPQAHQWRAMVQAIPDSWNYTRTISLNYQVLRDMYHARRKHRLSEWRELCLWMETLPYSELITTEF